MPLRREFGGKVVAITGGAGGIGEALARCFAHAGAQVAILDRNEEKAEALAYEISLGGAPSLAVCCDVASESGCRRAIAQVVRHFGGIDVLVNNAGITQRSLFAETEAEVFRRVMDVNLFGALYCTKAALPSLLARRGLVIVTSSIAGIAPLYERSAYAASKHALHGLFETLRAELSGTGVEVMIVCPGFTATGIASAALDGHGRAARHPQSTIGRIASADDVAEAVLAGARHGRRLLVLSAIGRATALLQRLSPALCEKLMARSIRRELARATTVSA